MVARAYADWARQPEFFKGSLTAAMIDRVDCPSKVRERFRQPPQFQHQGPYVPGHGPMDDLDDEERFDESSESGESDLSALEERDTTGPRDEGEAAEMSAPEDEQDERDERDERDEAREDADQSGEHRPRIEISSYNNSYGYSAPAYNTGYNSGYSNGGAFPPPMPVITQSTVDLNML